MAVQGRLFNVEATLPAEASSKTAAINMAKFCLMAVEVVGDPVATTLTFEAGHTAATTKKLLNQDGTAVTVTLHATPEGIYTLNANDFAAFEYIKVVSGATETSAITLRLYGYHV